MWPPSDRTDDGGLTPTPEAAQRRVDAAAQRAHEQALEAERTRHAVGAAGRLGHHSIDGLLGALADAETRAAASDRELERLRALPELKVGQRLRQPLRALDRRRRRDAGTADEHAAGVGLDAPTAERAAVTVVVLVRNRRRSLRPVIDWLRANDVEHVRIVDNGSTDPLTIAALTELDVGVFRTDEDLGDAAPWATGAMAGPLLDGDVLMIGENTVPGPKSPPNVLDTLRRELAAHPHVGAVDAVGSGDDGCVPWIRLVRRGASPAAEVVTVEAPWLVWAAADDDEPEERYAQLHEGGRPRTGPPSGAAS